MAVKVFFMLALIAFVVKADDCNCDPKSEEETKALWNFLSKLSEGLNEGDPEDTEMRAVYPGVLSPLLECNCLEKNRRKRKIMPDEEKSEVQETGSKILDRERKYIHFKTKRCAKGYVWIGIMCVPEEKFE